MRAAAGVIFIFEGKGTIVERGPDRACGMRGAGEYVGGPEGVGKVSGNKKVEMIAMKDLLSRQKCNLPIARIRSV